jgi:hypothetical protein
MKKLFVIALLLGACAAKPRPKVGLCEQPPEQVESKIIGETWKLDSCDYDRDNPGTAWCIYLMTVQGKKCGFVVATTQCGNWNPVTTICQP